MPIDGVRLARRFAADILRDSPTDGQGPAVIALATEILLLADELEGFLSADPPPRRYLTCINGQRRTRAGAAENRLGSH